VEIIQLNEETGNFTSRGYFEHAYPATKIMWMPDLQGKWNLDLLATTSDYLRLWTITDEGIKQPILLNNNKNSEFCAPLTNFDWNEVDPYIIGTSSIDTTCTIWNIERKEAITQLIAHDKEVYDIAFKGLNHFASVGADGSLRFFDRRALEHSTIYYESDSPLLRLSWNKQDEYYVATFGMDSSKVVIIDIRAPQRPAAELAGHNAPVNAIAWAPHSSCHICTAADDSQALIWDISAMPKQIEDPILAYTADAEINQLQWSTAQPDWIAIAYANKLQTLRV